MGYSVCGWIVGFMNGAAVVLMLIEPRELKKEMETELIRQGIVYHDPQTGEFKIKKCEGE